MRRVSRLRAGVYNFLKVILLSLKHFKDDNLQLRASALTYFSLLSIVPVLAMAFGIAKGFGLDKELEKQILENFSGQEEVIATSLDFARNLLNNSSGGLIAGIGLVFLFYTVMQLLGNIEKSFNDIWYINKNRPLVRKISEYMTIMLLGPILLILSNSLTITITQKIAQLTETVTLIGLFKGLIFPLLRLLPYTVIWILFTLVYMIMPNTTVRFKSAAIAGILAGSAFQLLQWALIYFAVGVTRYNAIYGSFAALPLFLVYLQLSWLIVLVGAEISYAIQNVGSHDISDELHNFSIDSKKRLALSVSILLTKNFKEGKPPLTFDEIDDRLEVPDRLLHEVLEALIETRILSETRNENDFIAYQPAQDTDRLNVFKILNSIESLGAGYDNRNNNEIAPLTDKTIEALNLEFEKSGVNQLLKKM